ncbi:hypothetical protein RJD24_13425 [Bacillaceae bacterium IKA-2]|jgi:flagellar motility protein MotE (MotC chaperone)|nr:hypothetical protein RJD24_13425 [Bacillaceae bacterium IKA-2]
MKKAEQEYSKVQWLIMVIFIPVVFAIILFSIIFSFMEMSIINEGKQLVSKIPFFSEYVKTDEQIQEEEEKINIEELTTKIDTHKREIGILEQQLTSKEDEVQLLLKEIELLMAQLNENETAELEIMTEYQELAKIYETMSAKNAANILIELPQDEAGVHLSYIKTDARAAIFAKMTPNQAAQFISLLSAN